MSSDKPLALKEIQSQIIFLVIVKEMLMNRQESEFLASLKTDEIGLSAKDINK